MNFLKTFFGGSKDEKSPMSEEIKNYKVYGNLFKREQKESKLLLEDALFSFSEGKTKFDFVLECFKDEESLYFPIATTMDLREQSVNDGDKMIRKYVFDLEHKLRMRIEFDVTDEKDLHHVLFFEKYFSQLLCITSLQKYIDEIPKERVETMCRHVTGKDLGRESETTSQKDSDVFSIAQSQGFNKNDNKSITHSTDLNRLTKELAGLNIEDGSKRVGKYQQTIKLFQGSKVKSVEKAKEEEELKEDITISNKSNVRLQEALLNLAQKADIKVCFTGCWFKAVDDELKIQQPGVIFAIKALEEFDYKILLFNQEEHVVHQYHSEKGLPEVNQHENYIRWIEVKDDQSYLHQMLFDEPHASQNVGVILQKCNFEKNNQMDQQKAFKEEEIQQIIRYSTHVVEDDYMEENKDYMKDYQDLDYTFNPNVYVAQGESITASDLRTIAQAKVLDRTFVSKGENIEVYRTLDDQDQDLEFLLSLPIVQGLNGEVFEPKKMLMQEQDTKMLLLNNEENKKVFYYDIEKGKVIQEFGADSEFRNGIRDICNQQKNGDLDNTQTFYSINSKNIFMMDPRISKGSAQSCITTNEKIYTQNNHFTCISSTVNGEFAIGSADGTVRLFNEVSKKAKNSLNVGYGDPIKGLDISQDGKWILATCQTYLILFPVYDQSNQGKSGFTSTIKIVDRPTPIRLQLSSEDQYYLKLKDIGFSPAKFDNCLNKKEKFIVSSTGAYTIVWDFHKVLQKKLQSYEIKKSEESIQYAEFKFNRNENVLAASTSRLEMQNIVSKKH